MYIAILIHMHIKPWLVNICVTQIIQHLSSDYNLAH